MRIRSLIDGFLKFREAFYIKDRNLYDSLVAKGQKPKTLVIACSDSRVSPATIFRTKPGDIFVVRSIANLVPPYGKPHIADSTSAALEYGVKALNVENIIVMAHSQCGGVQALMQGVSEYAHVSAWVSSIVPAAGRIRATLPDASPETRARACEQAAALTSLENLVTYPWISERVDDGSLRLHAWYFDMAEGTLWAFDPAQSAYCRLDA